MAIRLGKVEQEVIACIKDRGTSPARDIAYYTGRYYYGASLVVEASLTAALKRLVEKGCIVRERDKMRGMVYSLAPTHEEGNDGNV